MIEIFVKTLTFSAFIITAWYATLRCTHDGLNSVVMQWASIWGMLGATLGGYLLIASTIPHEIVMEETWILNKILRGNKATFGAFIGASFFVSTYLLYRRESFFKYADAALPAIAIGYALIRVGCFINGDDFGVTANIPWSVSFIEGTVAFNTHLERGWVDGDMGVSLPVHPTQLYSAMIGLLIFIVLIVKRSPRWPGESLTIALLIYGFTRFFIQFYRDDHWAGGEVIDQAQWFSLLFITLGISLWVNNKYISRNSKEAFFVEVSNKIYR